LIHTHITPTGAKGVELDKLTGFTGQKHSPPDREVAPTTPFFQLN